MNSRNILVWKKGCRNYSLKVTDRTEGCKMLSEGPCHSFMVFQAFKELAYRHGLCYKIWEEGHPDNTIWGYRHTRKSTITQVCPLLQNMHNSSHNCFQACWVSLYDCYDFYLGISWKLTPYLMPPTLIISFCTGGTSLSLKPDPEHSDNHYSCGQHTVTILWSLHTGMIIIIVNTCEHILRAAWFSKHQWI